MFCPHCGRANSDFAETCSVCGRAIDATPSAHTPAPVEARSARAEQYVAYVGPKNQDYYVDRFLRYDREGTDMSWHWPAFFVTFYWLLYRKMWLAAAAYFILPSLLYIPYSAAVDHFLASSDVLKGFAYLGWIAAVFLVPPMFANALYYRHANKKIATVAATTPGTERQLGELSAKGGTSHIVAIVVALFIFVVMLGVMAAIAIPAYQAYVIKAKTAQAEGVGKIAAESVAGYYYQNGRIPESLEAAGFSTPLPAAVKSLDLDPANGTIMMKLNVGVQAVDDGTLTIVPAIDGNQKVVWTCSSRDIDNTYLPVQCQTPRD